MLVVSKLLSHNHDIDFLENSFNKKNNIAKVDLNEITQLCHCGHKIGINLLKM